MPKANHPDVVRFVTLIKEGHCCEDDVRKALLSSRVKPLYHIDEAHAHFNRWAEDGSYLEDPIILGDDDEPYELFNGYVYLEINRMLGLLDCDFHRFTKVIDVEAGICPLPQFSLVEHVSMEQVLQLGGLTRSDAKLLERPLTSTKPKTEDVGPALRPRDSTPDEPVGQEPGALTSRFSMKKAALVMAHKDEWPSIESDLAEASSNGLAAAKAGARDWHESLALDWARARGKLRKTGAGSGLQQAMHNMSNLPGRTHKLSG